MSPSWFSPAIPANAPPEYRKFWQLWARRAFFEAHEVLEELWKREAGAQREFLNGLIHCAVALYQHERGNAVGAVRQMVRAQAKLAPLAPRFYEVSIEALLNAVQSEIAGSREQLTPRQQAQLDELRERLGRRNFGA